MQNCSLPSASCWRISSGFDTSTSLLSSPVCASTTELNGFLSAVNRTGLPPRNIVASMPILIDGAAGSPLWPEPMTPNSPTMSAVTRRYNMGSSLSLMEQRLRGWSNTALLGEPSGRTPNSQVMEQVYSTIAGKERARRGCRFESLKSPNEQAQVAQEGSQR